MILKLPAYHFQPVNGELMVHEDRAYKVLDSYYTPEIKNEELDIYESAHLIVEVVDVTETEAGQAIITTKKAIKSRGKLIETLLKEIQYDGIPVQVVNGQVVAQPDGEVLFDIGNQSCEGMRFILLSNAE
jgi:hypothetical protein